MKRIESDLIEALNPTANRSRPAPPSHLQAGTIGIFESLRSSIHSGRAGTRFLARCPDGSEDL